MSANQFLTDKEFAEFFLQRNTVAPGDGSVLDLEPRVEAWLDRAGMGHRRAFPIAIEAAKLAKPLPAPVRVPSPEEAARLDDLQGIGDPQPLTPEAIGAMDMAAYEKARSQFIRRSSGDGVGILGPIGN